MWLLRVICIDLQEFQTLARLFETMFKEKRKVNLLVSMQGTRLQRVLLDGLHFYFACLSRILLCYRLAFFSTQISSVIFLKKNWECFNTLLLHAALVEVDLSLALALQEGGGVRWARPTPEFQKGANRCRSGRRWLPLNFLNFNFFFKF